LHDWYGESPVASPSYIREHREYLDSLPFDGIVTYVRSADLSVNVSASVLATVPLKPEDVASCLEPLRNIRLSNLTENFAAVLGGRPPDFMEDWSVPVSNFALLAKAAKEAGLRGIYFDNETYSAPWGDYPGGVVHQDIDLEPYQDKARYRGRQVMEAMVKEFPDIVVIVLHGPYISATRAPSPLFPRWQRRNELLGPFFAGFVEGAGDRATVVDGGEIYHLRAEHEFKDATAWRKEEFPAELPANIRTQWKKRVRFAFGVYDRPFQGRAMNPEILESTLSRALRHSDGYVWLYIEGPSFLKPPAKGGASSAWIDAVRRARKQ
jgi:hypothetical protein